MVLVVGLPDDTAISPGRTIIGFCRRNWGVAGAGRGSRRILRLNAGEIAKPQPIPLYLESSDA